VVVDDDPTTANKFKVTLAHFFSSDDEEADYETLQKVVVNLP
jgi:hypothetical protein